MTTWGESLELMRLYYICAALWLFGCAFPTWPKGFSMKEKLIPLCICSFWQISAVRWNCSISSRGQEKCLPRSSRPCRGSYRVNSVTPSEKWDTLPAQPLYSFPLFHVQLSPSGLWACVWDCGHQQQPWGQGQRHGQGQVSFTKHAFEHAGFPALTLSRKSSHFLSVSLAARL